MKNKDTRNTQTWRQEVLRGGPMVDDPPATGDSLPGEVKINSQIVLLIGDVCREIKNLLVDKNVAYGNSIFDPVRIFSSADPLEQINVRIDDKLSRISRGKNTDKIQEDTLSDLIGYLILKRVYIRLQEKGLTDG